MKNVLKKISIFFCLIPVTVFGQDWQRLGPNRLPKGMLGTIIQPLAWINIS